MLRLRMGAENLGKAVFEQFLPKLLLIQTLVQKPAFRLCDQVYPNLEH